MAAPGLQDSRANYSQKRLAELGSRLGKLSELKQFPGLTIFTAGSYGRLEAKREGTDCGRTRKRFPWFQGCCTCRGKKIWPTGLASII